MTRHLLHRPQPLAGQDHRLLAEIDAATDYPRRYRIDSPPRHVRIGSGFGDLIDDVLAESGSHTVALVVGIAVGCVGTVALAAVWAAFS